MCNADSANHATNDPVPPTGIAVVEHLLQARGIAAVKIWAMSESDGDVWNGEIVLDQWKNVASVEVDFKEVDAKQGWVSTPRQIVDDEGSAGTTVVEGAPVILKNTAVVLEVAQWYSVDRPPHRKELVPDLGARLNKANQGHGHLRTDFGSPSSNGSLAFLHEVGHGIGLAHGNCVLVDLVPQLWARISTLAYLQNSRVKATHLRADQGNGSARSERHLDRVAVLLVAPALTGLPGSSVCTVSCFLGVY